MNLVIAKGLDALDLILQSKIYISSSISSHNEEVIENMWCIAILDVRES